MVDRQAEVCCNADIRHEREVVKKLAFLNISVAPLYNIQMDLMEVFMGYIFMVERWADISYNADIRQVWERWQRNYSKTPLQRISITFKNLISVFRHIFIVHTWAKISYNAYTRRMFEKGGKESNIQEIRQIYGWGREVETGGMF